MTVSFNYLKSLFNEDWDIGVLTGEQLHRVALHPVKTKLHYNPNTHPEDYTNETDFRKETNTLVLIRQGHSWDYTHYQESMDILNSNLVFEQSPYYMIYTNFKEAAIVSGLGVRAKNSLIYSYKFGFDHHIACIRFENEITDLPTDKRVNYKIWNRCIGCDDCAKACPVGAIHNDDKNPLAWWFDSSKCDDFIGMGNHPTVPSIKYYWQENVYPEVNIDLVRSITNKEDVFRPFEEGGLEGMRFDKNGYSFIDFVVRKNGVPVDVPFCRECTSQPRCSKWNGNFPYGKF